MLRAPKGLRAENAQDEAAWRLMIRDAIQPSENMVSFRAVACPNASFDDCINDSNGMDDDNNGNDDDNNVYHTQDNDTYNCMAFVADNDKENDTCLVAPPVAEEGTAYMVDLDIAILRLETNLVLAEHRTAMKESNR
jgi:hypothetical protein